MQSRSFKLKHIIQHYSWENNVLKEEEVVVVVVVVFLPVWVIYWLFTLLMEATAAAGMWEWKLEQYSDNRGRDAGKQLKVNELLLNWKMFVDVLDIFPNETAAAGSRV